MAKKDLHRQKRKLKQKSEYRRGKKVNEVTKKIAIKNVQSGADPFSVADGRPTMAMNVFQVRFLLFFMFTLYIKPATAWLT